MPRGKQFTEGERLLVQIRRESQQGKGARATMALALRGRLLELWSGRSGLVGDDKLTPEERVLLEAELPEPGQGAVGLRIVEPAPVGALCTEAAELRRRWLDILDRGARLDPPARLDPCQTFAAALANAMPAPPARIIADDPAAIPEIRAAFLGSAVEHQPEADWPIDLDALFDQALSETIVMRGGGSVHIERTRAAILIDVDSGTPETGSPEGTGLEVNLAAAAIVARQIRLRNLGGGIVLDLVGSDSRVLRERVRAALVKALASDPARPQVLGWTRLGHLELVRPRRGRPLAEALLEPRPGGALIKSGLTVAYEALRALRREAKAQPGKSWHLVVAPEVAAVFAAAAAAALCALEGRLARRIALEVDPDRDRERFQITPR
jgi:ribonuclease G